MIRTSIKKHKYLLIFILSIFIISILLGIFYGMKCNVNIKDDLIKYTNYRFNYLHISMPILIILSSFLLLSPLIGAFTVLIEGFSIGLIFYSYTKYFRLFGSIYSIINIIVFRLVYLFLIIILIIKTINQFIYIINSKNNPDFYKTIYIKYKNYIVIFLLILLNEIFTKCFFNKIYLYFSFLIK